MITLNFAARPCAWKVDPASGSGELEAAKFLCTKNQPQRLLSALKSKGALGRHGYWLNIAISLHWACGAQSCIKKGRWNTSPLRFVVQVQARVAVIKEPRGHKAPEGFLGRPCCPEVGCART